MEFDDANFDQTIKIIFIYIGKICFFLMVRFFCTFLNRIMYSLPNQLFFYDIVLKLYKSIQ